jgi:hypothetical protein
MPALVLTVIALAAFAVVIAIMQNGNKYPDDPEEIAARKEALAGDIYLFECPECHTLLRAASMPCLTVYVAEIKCTCGYTQTCHEWDHKGALEGLHVLVDLYSANLRLKNGVKNG